MSVVYCSTIACCVIVITVAVDVAIAVWVQLEAAARGVCSEPGSGVSQVSTEPVLPT